MTPAAIESAFAGLTIAVTAIMAALISDHWRSALAWFRLGLCAPVADRRRAAAIMVFGGLMPYGLMQLMSRTRVFEIPLGALQIVNFIGWSLFGLAAITWRASAVTEARGIAAGRCYLYTMCGAVVLCTVGLGLVHPFTVRQSSASHCDIRYAR